MSIRRIVSKSILFGFIITTVIYFLTLNSGQHPRFEIYFENWLTRAFSIGHVFKLHDYNDYLPSYEAGFPFISKYEFNAVEYYGSFEGCPCDGVSKPNLILQMIPTWAFVGNLYVWSSIVAAFIIFRENHENIRNRPR